MIREYHHPVKWSADVVTRKLGPVTCIVEMSDGRVTKRHIDQLRVRQNEEETPGVIERSTIDDYKYWAISSHYYYMYL
jgi:hypothetical protein